MKHFYNRIHLLCTYKMMKKNWRALTPDSFAHEMLSISDEEMLEFLLLSDGEIKNIEIEVQKFVEENRG